MKHIVRASFFEADMANKFLVDDAESTDLLPRRSADYVDEGDLAKFVSVAVEGLNLSEIEAGYSEEESSVSQ